MYTPSDHHYFDSKEFKEKLYNYEQARQRGESVFIDADDIYDVANYYYEHGNIDRATEALDYGITFFPNSCLLLSFRTRIALLEENDLTKAQQLVDQITDREDLEYHYTQAEIWCYQSNFKRADKYLLALYATIDEDNTDDFCLDTCELFIDYSAINIAEKWLHRIKNKKTADYQELQANIEMEKGNYERSEKIYNELLDQNPFSSPYWNQLASSQFMHNHIHDSILSSEYSIAINPNDPEANFNKANGLFSLGNMPEALKFYKRFCQLEPNNERGEMMQGMTYVSMENYDEGIKHLKRAEQLAKDHIDTCEEIFQELVFALSHIGCLEEALTYIDKMNHLPNTDLNLLNVLRGHVYLENGRKEEAEHHFQQATKESDGDPHIFLHIAMSVFDNGYISLAYQLLKTLFDHVKSSPALHDWKEGYSTMALCAKALKKEDEWKKYVRLAVEKNPEEARVSLREYFPEGTLPQDYLSYLK